MLLRRLHLLGRCTKQKKSYMYFFKDLKIKLLLWNGRHKVHDLKSIENLWAIFDENASKSIWITKKSANICQEYIQNLYSECQND